MMGDDKRHRIWKSPPFSGTGWVVKVRSFNSGSPNQVLRKFLHNSYKESRASIGAKWMNLLGMIPLRIWFEVTRAILHSPPAASKLNLQILSLPSRG